MAAPLGKGDHPRDEKGKHRCLHLGFLLVRRDCQRCEWRDYEWLDENRDLRRIGEQFIEMFVCPCGCSCQEFSFKITQQATWSNEICQSRRCSVKFSDTISGLAKKRRKKTKQKQKTKQRGLSHSRPTIKKHLIITVVHQISTVFLIDR